MTLHDRAEQLVEWYVEGPAGYRARAARDIESALREVVDACAKVAVESTERMILMYDGKLPYFGELYS